MNPNRKKDLHRKLAMPPVPAPPAGLAERIKGDIPRQIRLDTEGERRRFSQSLGVSLRVAASILILTIGAYAMLHVLSRSSEEKPAEALRQEVKAPARTRIAETTATPPPLATAAPPPAAKVAKKERREGGRKPQAATGQEAGAAVGQIAEEPQSRMADQVVRPAAAAAPAVAESITMTKSAANTTVPATTGLSTEMTVSPFSGRTILRISTGVPDAKVEVKGAQKIAGDLYVVKGDSATIRVHYRPGGVIERSVRRAEVRPWNMVSPQMREAVTRAESANPP